MNKKNVQVGNLNVAADFVDLGADVPPGPAANAIHSGLIHPGFQGLGQTRGWQFLAGWKACKAAKRALQQLEQNQDKKRSS